MNTCDIREVKKLTLDKFLNLITAPKSFMQAIISNDKPDSDTKRIKVDIGKFTAIIIEGIAETFIRVSLEHKDIYVASSNTHDDDRCDVIYPSEEELNADPVLVAVRAMWAEYLVFEDENRCNQMLNMISKAELPYTQEDEFRKKFGS